MSLQTITHTSPVLCDNILAFYRRDNNQIPFSSKIQRSSNLSQYWCKVYVLVVSLKKAKEVTSSRNERELRNGLSDGGPSTINYPYGKTDST